MSQALKSFTDTVTATGGVFRDSEGRDCPVGDPEWVDLGEAYIAACRELGIEPKIVEEESPFANDDVVSLVSPVLDLTGEGCYYNTETCTGDLWECETCGEEFCQFHNHVTGKGSNVECVACERERMEGIST